MIYILSILLINAWMLSLIWRKQKPVKRYVSVQQQQTLVKDVNREIQGKLDKMYIRSVVAEKMASRAWNTANSATLGVIALQKTLVVPRLLTKEQTIKNKLAKNDIDKLFTTQGNYDYLRPLLSDEDLELLDKIEEEKMKNEGNH